MGLPSVIVTQIGAARRSGVEARLAGFTRAQVTGPILPGPNRYRLNTANQITSDVESGRLPSDRRFGNALADYIAASAALHAWDGWSFFARACNAALAGDPDIAVHLGYYAELRAALSLLAGEGIGVFKEYHFYLDGAGRLNLFKYTNGTPCKKGTHEFTWEALKHWSTARSWLLFRDALFVGGVSVRNWLSPFPSGPSAPSVFSQDLSSMAFDLKVLTDDRSARNEASYRPTALLGSRSCPLTMDVGLLQSAWALSDPIGQALNAEILGNLLRAAFTASHSIKPSKARALFRSEVDQAVRLSNPDGSHTAWVDQLSNCYPSSTVMRQASRKVSASSPGHYHSVLSRAFVLLHFATRSCRDLYDNCGVSFADWSPWWEQSGTDRGLWGQTAPRPLDDLWAETGTILDDCAQIASKQSVTTREAWSTCSSEMARIARFEYVAVLLLAA